MVQTEQSLQMLVVVSDSLLQQVVRGAGCDLTDISVSGGQHGRIRHTSLSLSLLSFPKNTTGAGQSRNP